MNTLVNDLESKIKNINDKIYSLEKKMDKDSQKEEKLTHQAFMATVIGGCGYFFGAFIHPIIGLASIIYLSANIVPLGFIILDKQDKIEKTKEQIEKYKQEIQETRKCIETILKQEIIKNNPIKR